MAGEIYGYVRNQKLKTLQDLEAMEEHARRRDATSQNRQREGAEMGLALDFPPELKPSEGNPGRGYVQAFQDHLAKNNAKTMGRGPIALHSIVGVSRAWIEEAGDPFSPDNPRNIQLLEQAVAWANKWSDGGVIAARLDLDEKGVGAVDVIVVPIREDGRLRGRKAVSLNGPLEEMSLELEKRKASHRAALNTSWAAWAKGNLDGRVIRGEPERSTGRKHVPPDIFALRTETRKAAEKVKEDAARIEAEAARVAEDSKAVEEAKAQVLEAHAEVEHGRAVVQKHGNKVLQMDEGLRKGIELLVDDRLHVDGPVWTYPTWADAILQPALGLLRPIVETVNKLRNEVTRLRGELLQLRDEARHARDESVTIRNRLQDLLEEGQLSAEMAAKVEAEVAPRVH